MMNMDDVVIHVQGMLERANPPVTEECCIYRVPLLIRQLNEEAYTPKVISIGPYHHKNSLLQNMERHKLTYCNSFLKRTNTSMASWIHYIAGKELQIRQCYSDALEFSPKELVEIICVDSGFILEHFWTAHYKTLYDKYLSTPWFGIMIFYDLVLLENQLPFFVLNDLFNLSTVDGDSDTPSFIQLTFEYFDFFNRLDLSPDNLNTTCHHFTDLIRTFHLCGRNKTTRSSQWPHIPSATKLSGAGIRLGSSESKCFLNLSFSKKVLKIPNLRVDDGTELLFRNMVALEQFHYPDYAYIAEYALVLQYLVNTGKDVDILVKAGIMKNLLGDSDSAAERTKRLCRNTVLKDFSSDYVTLWQELDASYKSRRLKLKSTLRRDYCKGPWQTAATAAAIVVLILSFVQTICSIWQIKQS
ncbi:UPF0481 protein At3g47200-like isoform X1 [Vigna radiata var. radiata]|uniref:UPF0481 protein At3g47200-like isoform X1 n=2 Tax=Vigna radiata var. radiata TaxID=3916 RepID=A0A1S3TZZ5_VIGRR|nr:UPF0481 protein At3g47200-like isoform X1 [Vigna radiata var. radiata]